MTAEAALPEPVVVIGKDFRLQWAAKGTLTEIAERTGIRVGSLLYAHPPASPTAEVVEELATALRGLLRMTDFADSEPWVVKAHAALAKVQKP